MKKFIEWCNRSDSWLARVLPGSWLLTFLFDGQKVFENGLSFNAILTFLLYLLFGGYLLNAIFFILPSLLLDKEQKTTNLKAVSAEIIIMSLITAYLLEWL